MTAATGRHCARLHDVTRPISSAKIARAMELKHWRHRRRLSIDDAFAVLFLAVVATVVGVLAALVSGWSA